MMIKRIDYRGDEKIPRIVGVNVLWHDDKTCTVFIHDDDNAKLVNFKANCKATKELALKPNAKHIKTKNDVVIISTNPQDIGKLMKDVRINHTK